MIEKGLILLAVLSLVGSSAKAEDVNEVVKVCGQNLQNYYWNYDQTERTSTNSLWVSNYQDDEGRSFKTNRIVDALLSINADIYAFNEVEATSIILQQLADSLTKYSGTEYKAVADNISYTPDSYDNHLKSGFIYRTGKVRPYGSNYSMSSVVYYRDVMRMQTFECINTHERFAISMNHFKAGGDDQEDARVVNASHLLQNLSKALDNDVLILGDLNCETDAASIQSIVDAGYEEQLLRFAATTPYTHCYDGGRHLDHVLANATMAEQVTRAWVEHVCTTCYVDNYNRTYSDHDPYVVLLRLGTPTPSDCDDLDYTESFASTLGDFQMVDGLGSDSWGISTKYSCALMNGYHSGANDDWLVSPRFDLRGKSSAGIRFTHCAGYGTLSLWPEHLKLLISSDFIDDVTTATWTEIPIPTYGSKNWDWQDVSVEIPSEFMGSEDVTVAFHYITGTDGDIPQWEVKNFNLQAQCGQMDGITQTHNTSTYQVRKVIENGTIYILMSNGRRYTLSGMELR